uniref:Uncharacterized protein n=1 Tax=Arundo donax TaxID=35708 RepID=A0A0A8ZU01_ARUDO
MLTNISFLHIQKNVFYNIQLNRNRNIE